MKILHVVQGYAPAIGGTERLIQKVSEKLVERHQDEVTVYTTTAFNCEVFWLADQPQMQPGVEKINGVTVRRFPIFNRLGKLRWFLATSTYKLRLPFNDWFRVLLNGPLVPGMTKAISQSGVDVVAASSFPLMHMQYALWGGRRANVPVILHGGIHTADPFGFERPMILRAIRHADAYIANSTFERDYLAGRGIPSEHMNVIGVGVDVEPYERVNGGALRQRLGWGDAPVVAFVGQQVPHKGIDMVIEAMQQIWVECPQACLLIAGARTTYSVTLEGLIAQLSPDLRSRVAILSNFAEEDKPAIFAACDLLAFPSGQESFGIVFLEAWAAGKPVIGARVGAIPTVIDEGKDGLLIQHRDVHDLVEAIRTLLSQPDLRRQLGEAGRLKVLDRYTWDMVADGFRHVYLRALQARPGQRRKESN
jgi:glycosyltransferase involved in cell wall biosynthesis